MYASEFIVFLSVFFCFHRLCVYFCFSLCRYPSARAYKKFRAKSIETGLEIIIKKTSTTTTTHDKLIAIERNIQYNDSVFVQFSVDTL